MADSSARLLAVMPQRQPYQLQCMEIVGGNRATERSISSPGLDIWVASRPFKGSAGGDVHYLSMCGSGRVTRVAMADVSGHGLQADERARRLRRLMRKYINLLDQTRLARAMNREFPRTGDAPGFATVLFVTYFAPTDHLIICNAGHPHPIWFRRRIGSWEVLKEDMPDRGPSIRQAKAKYLLKHVANLPLGVIESTDYRQFDVKLEKDDLVVIYSDALIEAVSPQHTPLEVEGLRRLAAQIYASEPEQVGRALLAKIEEWQGHAPPDDDQTVIVLRHNASNPPRISVSGALKTTAKVLGLVRV
jgi:phosphoserine phosphatase RsbU/P